MEFLLEKDDIKLLVGIVITNLRIFHTIAIGETNYEPVRLIKFKNDGTGTTYPIVGKRVFCIVGPEGDIKKWDYLD